MSAQAPEVTSQTRNTGVQLHKRRRLADGPASATPLVTTSGCVPLPEDARALLDEYPDATRWTNGMYDEFIDRGGIG
jgi:hypothetical protein